MEVCVRGGGGGGGGRGSERAVAANRAANRAAHPSRVIDQSPNSRLTGTNTAAGGVRRSWLTWPPFIPTVLMNDHSARRSSRRSITGLHWEKDKEREMHNSLINAPGISLWTLVCELPFAAIIADCLPQKRNFASSCKAV